MSLRSLVALLLVANLGYFVWSQGVIERLLGGPGLRSEREPGRLARQVAPDSVRVLPTGAAASAALAATASARAASAAAALPAPRVACLEAGPLAASELPAAESALADLPAGSWVRITDVRPGRYAVVMGPFATSEALQKKEDELRRLRVPADLLDGPPALSGAVSLGRYDGREAAEAALASLSARGVRTGRIESLAPPVTAHRLRVAEADPALAARLAALDGQTLAGGFHPCDASLR